MILKFKFIFIILLLVTTLHSATLTLTTKYGATGGLAGDFNEIGDHVNGRAICPTTNDNTNSTPGCDMSGDAGYNNNNTDDPSDDYYDGDLVVRTNDSFELGAKYSWLGTKGEDEITIKGTLPAVTGFIWDGIPGSCDISLSTLSEDRKVISCVRKGADSVQGNNVGSYSETMWFAVKVEGDAANGSKPGDITLEISEISGTAGTLTDGVLDGNDANKLVITSSPRWNIDGYGGPGYYTTSYGVKDDQNNSGWYLWYNFTIEVDEVKDETEDLKNPSLGNEAILGDKNATVSFTADLSKISPNAKLVTWEPDNGNVYFRNGQACTMDAYTNGGEPYPIANTTYPDRSILTEKGVRSVSCIATGQTVDIQVENMDATLTDAPIKEQGGALLPVNRKIASIGVMRVFVPLSDVEAGEDGIEGTADDGELVTTNCYDDFNPSGISGTANFNGTGESKNDNCYNITLYSSRGSWRKDYRKGWSDQADQKELWNKEGETIGWSAPPTDAAIVQGGDGTITPEGRWGTYTIYNNTGGTDIDRPMICDVIDTETYMMELLNETTDNAGTFLDDTKHAVDLNYGPTETVPDLTLEYAVGYVGSWPPDPDVAAGYAVAKECNATSITWYPDFVEASQHGAVSKVRVSAPVLPTQKYIAMRIKHKARSNYLTSGDPIPNKTLLVNYATYKSALTDDKYKSIGYMPHNADEAHEGGVSGDRLTMQRAKVRILKEMNPVAVSPGSEPVVTLDISFTNDSLNPESDIVQIVDVLPEGLAYKNGSTSGTYGNNIAYGEPQVFEATDANCNTYASTLVSEELPCGMLNSGTGKETILLWDLGIQQTGTVFNNLNFTTVVSIDAPKGVLSNYVQIESPADDSEPSKRVSNANVNNSVPSALLIVKSVQTPLNEINKDGDLNWMEFRVGLRNGSSSDLTDLDVIDVLPFNGDGLEGSFKFTPQDGITVDRDREPATRYDGNFSFEGMTFDDNAVCDASTISYWYTNSADTLDISPKSTSNTKVDGTVTDIWCEGTKDSVDASCGFTNKEVTAVRIRGVAVPGLETCFLNLKFSTNNNMDEDIYSNTAGATAKDNTGTYLDGVLSNTVSAHVYASSLGDRVWYDRNADGIQDSHENGIDGVTVNLYKAGTLIDTTETTDEGQYSFKNLLHGSDYVVEFVKPNGYLISSKGSNGSLDSDINVNGRTDTIILGLDENNNKIDAGFYTPIISGNVFVDGNNDGTVGAEKAFSTYDGTQLYVTLLDGNGAILASKAVSSDGNYSFDGDDNVTTDANYTVVLAGTKNVTTSTLPTPWNSADGEHIGSGSGLDNAIDGQNIVLVVQEDVAEVNFGINKKPIAEDVAEPIQFNPGGVVKVDVPDINVSDNEDDTPTTVTIVSVTSNGTLYYNGTVVTAGQVISNFDNSLLMVDPDAGEQTVNIVYTTTDRVGVVSDEATITMPFKDLKISGNLYIDGNGNGNIDGTATSSADGIQLYATLVNAGTAVASMPLTAGGSYGFDIESGVKANTTFSVVLSESNGSITASLPAEWSNEDGEKIGLTGTDGSNDGILAVSVLTSDIININFGINKKPVAEDVSEPTQVNPGTGTNVNVPDLNISDEQTITGLTVTIITLPDNATLYYNGVAVTADQNISNFDNSLLTIDPEAGDQNVSFNYSTTDGAGTESDTATVRLEFSNIIISGTLFNDGNGNGNVDGNATDRADGSILFVTLLDASGTEVSSKALANDGTYYFDSVDGLAPDSNYTVVLTKVLHGLVPSLPTDWNNADGENIGLTGLDGSVDGINVVPVLRVDIPEINFGINKKPVAEDQTEAVQFNPGDAIQVVVPDLNTSDNEDGIPPIVTITQLPTNGTLYYNGVAVVLDTNISDVNVSAFTVDPNDGDVTVVFEYTTTDSVGVVSEPATVTMPFVGLQISGNIFNDGDNDGTVNGTGIAAPSGEQLFVTLLDENETVIASHAVNGDGSYLFSGVDGIISNSAYRVVLSTSEDSKTAGLPTNWSNQDGEHIGTDAGTDGSNDGLIEVSVLTSNVEEVNFGINKKPVASDVTEPLQLNPGVESQVDVPDLVVSDNEDSVPSDVTIVTVPVNGTLYYNGVEVTAGQEIADFNNSLLTVDPDNGDLSISFTYTTTDAVGVESEAATVSMSFEGLEIRGNVFNDGNNDGTVNGTKISQIETTALQATLLDDNESVMATIAIEADGSYTFTGLDGIIPNSSYVVVVSTEANATTSTLLSNWNNADGEHIGTGVGLDGNADGKIVVPVSTEDVEEVNFGLNEQPVAQNVVEALQINPGAEKQVFVPDVNVSDNEDGEPTTVTVTELPSNGVLYYDGVALEVNSAIEDFNASKLTVNPIDGDVTVVFEYTTTDSVGVVSEPATVTMPFVGLQISGNIFNDGDNDGTVNGTGIAAPSGEQLFVTLLDENETVIASHAVNGDGSYLFSGVDGIISNSEYRVVLSTSEDSKTAGLPTNWSNQDGEHIGTDAGTDGSNDGLIEVSVLTSNVEEVNFGINKKPVASDVTEPLQLNPGVESQVDVPDLVVSDNEDSVPSDVTIVTVPVNGTLYYNGVEVTAGQEIADFNNSLLTVDPDNGDLSISFTYTTTDAVGVESEAATVSMSFEGLEIRGNVFNDGNNDGTVNGTKISQIETTALQATLLDDNESVMATIAIEADGSYTFTGLDGIIPNSSYVVVVSTEANATTSTLLSNWNNADGEHIGTGVGLDGNADGKIVVPVSTEDVEEVNFGLNEQPVAQNVVEALQINPGAEKQVLVPTLAISDNEDTTPSIITITTLPSNGTLYYEGTEVVLDANFTDANLSKFTINPIDGDVTVVFEYTTTDSVGVVSEPATVMMPFYGVSISGQVYMDTNKDGNVDGLDLSTVENLELYVNIVDANGRVIASVLVDNNGSYTFDTSVGLVPHEPYTVRLSKDKNTTNTELPRNWMHLDTTGRLEFMVTSSDIRELNFGLNQQPVVLNVTAVSIVNPGTDVTVAVPDLNISMNEDDISIPTTVTLSNLPTNGILYYDGAVVTEGQVINDFNNTLLTVDPNEANVTVVFNYTSTDEGGFESEPATVSIPFSDPDTDGDGIPNNQDLDDDNDGILDTVENNTSTNNQDTDLDGIPDRLDLDSDGDGILDLEESNENPTAVDADGNGILDSTTDADNDGVMDIADANDNDATSGGSVTPIDTDEDGQPDFQDVDSDNDGLSDLVEGGTDATFDMNTDGILDNQTDTDGDGIADLVDSDNAGTPATTPDTDEDGTDNYRDLDSDSDTLSDVIEIGGTDSDNDGHINPIGTLISGINLPDENSNGIPDVLEIKLKDDIKRAAPGEVVTIDLLENDSGDIDKSSIKLVIPEGFTGVARLSDDGKRMVVDGEGEWSVDENGIVTFTPEDGFREAPTPIQYKALTPDGTKEAIANITIVLADVAGTTTDEDCETYTDNSVPIFSPLGLLLLLLLSSIVGWSLVRKEN